MKPLSTGHGEVALAPHGKRWMELSSSPAAEAARALVALLCCHSISHFWGLKGGEGVNSAVGRFLNLCYCCQNCNNKGNFIIAKVEEKVLSVLLCSPDSWL